MLKIDQKEYIRDLLKSEEMISCYPTIFLVKIYSTLYLDLFGDPKEANMIVY